MHNRPIIIMDKEISFQGSGKVHKEFLVFIF